MNVTDCGQSGRLTLAAIREAQDRIRGKVIRTPVISCAELNEMIGADLHFKCENLQLAGAFKSRGATNAICSLSDTEVRNGVVTHSSGNHAAALARAARMRGARAYIVMPSNAPRAKQDAVKRYGGEIIFCEPTLDARETTAARVISETGATLIHAYDDLRVMAGQGTAALELLEDVPNLDVILCPVGGGGLLSGVAVAAKSLRPDVVVAGVEPADAADAARSLNRGELEPSVNPQTIADGLLTSLSARTFREIKQYVDDIVLVPDSSIVDAMRRLWTFLKLVIEPSGAVAYAGLEVSEARWRGKRVGIILSGGNLDLDVLPWQPQYGSYGK